MKLLGQHVWLPLTFLAAAWGGLDINVWKENADPWKGAALLGNRDNIYLHSFVLWFIFPYYLFQFANFDESL